VSVVCRQVDTNGDQEYVIEPHYAGQTDHTLLGVKSQGAIDKGWDVEWTSPTSFTATKVRWEGVTCTRTFEVR